MGRARVPLDRQRQIIRYLIPFALLAMFVTRISGTGVDLDIFHEMSLIRESILLGHIPLRDYFAYTATLPFCVHHEWGAGVLAYFVSMSFGATGLLLLRYLLAAILAALCIATARIRNQEFVPAFSAIAPLGIYFIGFAFSAVRAHLYSLCFAACLLNFLERDRKGDRSWMWKWFLLCVVWLNIHGGYVIGIGLLGCYWLEKVIRREPSRRLLPVIGAMIACIAINPFGLHYYGYLLHALTMPRPEIPEWNPTGLSLANIPFFLSLLLVGYVIWKRGFRRLGGISVIGMTAAETALHGRFLPFYGVAMMCYLPGAISEIPAGEKLKSFWKKPPVPFQLGWASAAIFFSLMMISYRSWQLELPVEGHGMVYPTGAVQYLSHHHFRGNAMVPFECGAFVSWKLFPARVSIDSRYEVAYPEWWVNEVFRFYRAEPGWYQTLTRFPTDVVLLHRTQSALSNAMNTIHWRLVYMDKAFEIYARPGLRLDFEDLHDQRLAGPFP